VKRLVSGLVGMTQRSLAGVKSAIIEHDDYSHDLDLHDVLATSGIILVLVDAQSAVRFCTPAALSLCQITEGAFEHALAAIQVATNDRMLTADVEALLQGQDATQREVQATDGRWFLRCINRCQVAPSVNGAVIVFTDITSRMQAMTEMHGAKRQAELASIASMRQLSAACHDLRQPMHTLGLIGGVLSQSMDNAVVKRLTAQMDYTLHAMSGLLCSIHHSCRASAGALQPEIRSFSVGAALRSLQEEFRYHAEAYGIELRVAESALSLNSDPVLFEQMIRSLLEHVRKTYPRKIVLGCQRDHDSARIEFWCSKESVSRPRQQAAGRERISSLPLGLDLAKRLADVLGFRLSQGKGHATEPDHIVKIPAKFLESDAPADDHRHSAAAMHARQPVPSSAGASADLEGLPFQKTVVHVVDDDADVRVTVQRMLQNSTLAVDVHESAEAFLASYVPAANACLVLDANLTGMSGIDLIRRLNEMDCRPPTIMISGRGEIDVIVEAIRCGAIDFVEKPLHRDKLLGAIERAVVQSRQFEREREDRQTVLARMARLTPRQAQVMQLMLDGKSSKTIAAHLFMSRRTVESHRATVMKKMEAKSLPELARMASLTKKLSSHP
jgi:FixJ family two-component response regulator/signal transduction histidine kinase